MREYVGLIWVGEEPGKRFRLLAESLEEARAAVVEEYGEGVISLWNPDDAARPRAAEGSRSLDRPGSVELRPDCDGGTAVQFVNSGPPQGTTPRQAPDD